MNIELSVVIVTFNNSACILDCLFSLVKACSVSTQVCIIDNASHDGTIPLIRRHAKNMRSFAEFECIENSKNQGYTAAVNQGLGKAKGKYILFLNPDMVITGDMDYLMSLLESPNTGVVAPQLRFKNGHIQASCRRFPKRRDVLFECSGLSFLYRDSAVFNRWKMPDFDHEYSR